MDLAFMEFQDTAIKFVLMASSGNFEFDGSNSFNILPNVLNFY